MAKAQKKHDFLLAEAKQKHLGSAGKEKAIYYVEGVQIRADGKRPFSVPQKLTEAKKRQRKLKIQQLRRDHQRCIQKKWRSVAEVTSGSASSSSEEADMTENTDSETISHQQPGLLLDLSRAVILPGPPQIPREKANAQKELPTPFEAATATKDRLGRNDIWALTTDDSFEDWTKVVLVRSVWRGASPHSQCIKISVMGPWPSTQSYPPLSLLSVDDNNKLTRATLPPPPPLLLHLRQLLQGGGRAISKVKAIWVGRFSDELAATEACQRLLRAEMALGRITEDALSADRINAAVNLGEACAARILGVGSSEGNTNACAEADAKISQSLDLAISSADAEAILCWCSTAGGHFMLNREQQHVLVAVSRWFAYSDGRQPFESDENKKRYDKRKKRGAFSDKTGRPNPVLHASLGDKHSPISPADGILNSQMPGRENHTGTLGRLGNASTSDSACLFGSEEEEILADDSIFSAIQDASVELGGTDCMQHFSAHDDPDKPLAHDCKSQMKLLEEMEGATPREYSLQMETSSEPVQPSKMQLSMHSTAHGDISDTDISALSEQERSSEHNSSTPAACSISESPLSQLDASESLKAAASPMPTSSAPVLLVHGVFGAGKSFMLAACLAALCRLLEMAKCKGRVLFICATNAAVDGVLLRLMQQFDCCDFARIGRLSEMQTALLPYAVCGSAIRNTAVQEFKCILSQITVACEPSSPSGAMARALLADINQGSFPPPMQQWKRRRIWATTCSSFASSDLFSDGSCTPGDMTGSFFPFLLMDEASQVAETLAAAVLTRARPLRCLLLGDTRQLPPTSHLRGALSAISASLFSRLLRRALPPKEQAASSSIGRVALPLDKAKASEWPLAIDSVGLDSTLFCVFQMRVQYRCHPQLGELASELYYGSFVVHGVSAAQRISPVPAWGGALCAALVREGREAKCGRSLINALEAGVVARLVSYALRATAGALTTKIEQAVWRPHAPRLGAGDIGVICFYRAQVDEVKRQMLRVLPKGVVDSVQVSTVDAFQGSEREIILLSLVRSVTSDNGFASQSKSADFLNCPHRVCVALTRAKRQLLVVGGHALLRHGVWSHIYRRATKITV